MAQKKPLVFISCIHEEEYLATALQSEISSVLLGGLEFFVASLPTSIEPGKRWLAEIDKALSASAAVLVLCSNVSMLRPWINFETGAAWLSQLLGRCSNLIPICHSGLRPEELIEPLHSLQAMDITNERDIKSLISLLCRLANLEPPTFDAKALIANLPPTGLQLGVVSGYV